MAFPSGYKPTGGGLGWLGDAAHFVVRHKLEVAVGAGMVVAAFVAPELEPMLGTAMIRVAVAARVSAGSAVAVKTVANAWKAQSPGLTSGQKLVGTAGTSLLAARSSITKNGAILYAAVKAVVKSRHSPR